MSNKNDVYCKEMKHFFYGTFLLLLLTAIPLFIIKQLHPEKKNAHKKVGREVHSK